MTNTDRSYYDRELPAALRSRGTVKHTAVDMSADNIFITTDACWMRLDASHYNVSMHYFVNLVPEQGTRRFDVEEFFRVWRKFDKQFHPTLKSGWMLVVDADFYVTPQIDAAGWNTLLDVFAMKLTSLLRGIPGIKNEPLGAGAVAAPKSGAMKAPLVFGYRKTKDNTVDAFNSLKNVDLTEKNTRSTT